MVDVGRIFFGAHCVGVEGPLGVLFLDSTEYCHILAETFDESCAWPADLEGTCSPGFHGVKGLVTQLGTHEVI